MEHDGELYKQPRAELHPPAFASFRGRTYAAAVSPESARIVAKLGCGLILIAQKPWSTTVAETAAYRELFIEVNGHEPPRPMLFNFACVDPDAGRAREMHDEYAMGYARSTIGHYEFGNERLETIKGYEYYAGLRKNILKHGMLRFNRFLADLQMSGTPEALVEETVERVRALDAAGVVNVLNFGGMPAAVAERNFAVFREQVLPRLQAVDRHRSLGSTAQDLSATA
jgi:alkanesulfonate monooxygenase SsuD/methylene tetrahydromethanopterin reductase-like flavin-dependent oxidoreductase (luciferase family)